jgi:hypothetical protein
MPDSSYLPRRRAHRQQLLPFELYYKLLAVG